MSLNCSSVKSRVERIKFLSVSSLNTSRSTVASLNGSEKLLILASVSSIILSVESFIARLKATP
ncbi:wsv074 [White spot syndrome virus]|uniref:Wsv074 n=3 Tax=White spot syndrome virus TaxID=342409 RepID=Q8VBA3_WSSVS|nr:wsv074 [Shrimp white spot syndrome virus]AFX59451.1 wsv074 [White spot syndrome virus]AAL33078.1 wsv074 [Shrimp white spot syndrome virus]AAL88999.1 WSSV131 [Shrimp white spot syndrome virus]AWQ60263.1 wsv074 [Shrimp white spot syndrome virus]AWQ60680.1 wsv074 [Shrimp white spot syndrome virus]